MSALTQQVMSYGVTAPVVTYATWNPADKGSGVTLSNGDLTAAGTGGSQNFARSTIGKATGKWYWELTANSVNVLLGVCASTVPFVSTNFVFSTVAWAYWGSDGRKYTNAVGSVYGSTFTTNDVLSIALDMGAGKIWFAKNGTWQASGDPAAGTNEAYSGLTGTVYAAGPGDGGGARQFTANFGATAFVHTPPVGFNAGLYS